MLVPWWPATRQSFRNQPHDVWDDYRQSGFVPAPESKGISETLNSRGVSNWKHESTGLADAPVRILIPGFRFPGPHRVALQDSLSHQQAAPRLFTKRYCQTEDRIDPARLIVHIFPESPTATFANLFGPSFRTPKTIEIVSLLLLGKRGFWIAPQTDCGKILEHEKVARFIIDKFRKIIGIDTIILYSTIVFTSTLKPRRYDFPTRSILADLKGNADDHRTLSVAGIPCIQRVLDSLANKCGRGAASGIAGEERDGG